MDNSNFEDLRIPVIVKATGKNCDVFIPDLSMTIHGSDFVEAMANASLKASAIYFYNFEKNIEFKLSTEYDQAVSMCTEPNQFVTYICLIA